MLRGEQVAQAGRRDGAEPLPKLAGLPPGQLVGDSLQQSFRGSRQGEQGDPRAQSCLILYLRRLYKSHGLCPFRKLRPA